MYLCPPVKGWPSYIPRHRVPYSSPSTTLRATLEVLGPVSTWRPLAYVICKGTKWSIYFFFIQYLGLQFSGHELLNECDNLTVNTSNSSVLHKCSTHGVEITSYSAIISNLGGHPKSPRTLKATEVPESIDWPSLVYSVQKFDSFKSLGKRVINWNRIHKEIMSILNMRMLRSHSAQNILPYFSYRKPAAYFLLITFSCAAYSSVLKKEATCFSKTSVDFHRIIRRFIPEEKSLQSHRCDKLNSNISWTLLLHWSSLFPLPILCQCPVAVPTTSIE
jgi:hypothetical protein